MPPSHIHVSIVFNLWASIAVLYLPHILKFEQAATSFGIYQVSRRHRRNYRGIVTGIVFLIFAGVIVYLIFFNSSNFLQPSLPIPVVSVAGNWAGYVAGSNLFFPQPTVTAVTGSWTVPAVKDTGSNAYSSVWIGIGGQFDSSLVQVGTEQDYVNGAPAYSAWYEMLPSNEVPINTIHVSPGDQIQASISLSDPNANTWSISIKDLTSGESFQQNFQYNSGKLSAEWIVEQPSVSGALANLANFGSVTFSNCQATISGRTGGITSFSDNRVYLQPQVVNNQSIQLVNVSGVSSDGTGFTVTYVHS